jgi:hypothetical protein
MKCLISSGTASTIQGEMEWLSLGLELFPSGWSRDAGVLPIGSGMLVGCEQALLLPLKSFPFLISANILDFVDKSHCPISVLLLNTET